jgi:hypothetical protein
MSLENWDDTTKVTYDGAVLDEVCSLRVDAGHIALIMRPVGIDRTFVATALRHAAVRQRYSVLFQGTDVALKRSVPHAWTTATTPRCASSCGWTVDPRRPRTSAHGLDTSDLYDLIVEGHRAASTVVTSKRSRSSGWARWSTPCWPSPRSTRRSRRPPSWCSRASRTGSTKSVTSRWLDGLRPDDAGGPRHDHIPNPRPLPAAVTARPAASSVDGRALLHCLSQRGRDRRPRPARAGSPAPRRSRGTTRAPSLTVAAPSSLIAASALGGPGSGPFHWRSGGPVPSRWPATLRPKSTRRAGCRSVRP